MYLVLAQVVYGGWPSIYDMEAFEALLTNATVPADGGESVTALELTDVLDVHYHGVADWASLRRFADSTAGSSGRGLGIWQTEVG